MLDEFTFGYYCVPAWQRTCYRCSLFLHRTKFLKRNIILYFVCRIHVIHTRMIVKQSFIFRETERYLSYCLCGCKFFFVLRYYVCGEYKMHVFAFFLLYSFCYVNVFIMSMFQILSMFQVNVSNL